MFRRQEFSKCRIISLQACHNLKYLKRLLQIGSGERANRRVHVKRPGRVAKPPTRAGLRAIIRACFARVRTTLLRGAPETFAGAYF